MPYKEREINKLYYSIGEVARMFDVNASLIRFWEKEFEILQPRKNKKGNRLFTQEDLENLKIIYHLVKEKGYTLQGAKEYLKSNKGTESERQKVLDSLQKLRSFLVELKEEL
ncbi:DNA-binding transcriptional MerR regulator [Anseongella ginsenosidimutans]|uniref:DNA-binding transcriptional MerR regulator n=1 Tax=Anseongella ginsenosidimutans TaxID=496056 RepID=A0A4R3KSB2_9SPHI|nr:MerR family transcriptional regulator [Anseongella ginsenosidimutans]QEC52934.1 MerR family transcriptional regulator [Anseongella ginsenosidimutans]TCS87329.1 DNA-binding transcriptional MerR regulator [Anseongella ginsenosidimutans]